MDAHLWDERYAAADLVWSAGPNQVVAAECAGLPAGRAVDLAAGEGRNAIWLAQQGWQVTAVDFSQVGLDKGRRVAEAAGTTGVEWVCADATAYVPAEPVDLVVIAYLQVTAADRRAAVTSAVRSLAAGGTLLWVSHDTTNIAEGTGGPQDPTVLMSAEDVLADLTGVDVDVVRAERVTRSVTGADGEVRNAYDALVRVVRRG